MDIAEAINIRQRQYAFAIKNTETNLLVTNNIFVCTAWFGFDKTNGLAFLCHFDSPKSTDELPRIVDELNKLIVPDLNIESYILNGSKIANCVRTNKVRENIVKQAKSLTLSPHAPTDLGYSSNGYRSRVVVSANCQNWLREDYILSGFRKVSAESKVMTKAHGSA